MDYKNIARQALTYALSRGAEAAKIDYLWMDQTVLQATDLELTQLQESSTSGIQMTLWVEGRVGSYATNRLEPSDLESFIGQCVDNTRLLNPDPDRTLPDPNRYYALSPDQTPSLGNYDPALGLVPIENKIRLLMAMPRAIMDADDRIIDVTANWNDRVGGKYSIDSQGWEGEQLFSGVEMDCEVACCVPGTDRRPSDDWYETAFSLQGWSEATASQIAQNALRLVRPKLDPNAGPIPAGRYRVLMRPRWVCRVIDPLLNAMMGTALFMQRSFLLDRLNEPIASPLLTLTDRPHKQGAMGASWFDFEGVATRDLDLIRRGVLKTYLIGTYNAHRLKMEPTISDVMVLCMEPGSTPTEQLVASEETLLDITGFLGGNSNEATGDFSFGIEGMLYKGGKPVQAVSGMNVTGNLLDLWKSIVAISSDQEEVNENFLSSVIFDNVTVV